MALFMLEKKSLGGDERGKGHQKELQNNLKDWVLFLVE